MASWGSDSTAASICRIRSRITDLSSSLQGFAQFLQQLLSVLDLFDHFRVALHRVNAVHGYRRDGFREFVQVPARRCGRLLDVAGIRMMARNSSSRCARAERRVGSASWALCRKYVDGAIGSTAQIDSTHNTPMVIDEANHHFARRSSSACAKYADAFLRISLARFSSRFSRSSSFSRCRSSVVKPARCPASRSAWRTQRRSVSVVHPSLPAIDAIAAHCDGCSAPCSRTIRTARSRTSGEYRLGRAMGSILSRMGPPTTPVRFTYRRA